jgi:hypothetical protein
MDKLNVVFILGAGFSAESGCPVISNFLEKARKIYRRADENEIINFTLEDYQNVENAISELHRMQAKAYLDLDNIETLFGALEFGIMLDKFGSRKGKEIEMLRDSLIKVIVTTIEYSSKFQYKAPELKIFPDIKYMNFFNKIKQLESDCNFSFITFNYDLILDMGLLGSDIEYNYAIEKSDFKEIPLLKLHGSLNWYKGVEQIRVISIPAKQNIQDVIANKSIYNDDDVLRSSNEIVNDFLTIGSKIISDGNIPIIIPPTMNKFKYQENLNNIWKKAASVLSAAELIVVIGYSMPETDVYFKYLYSLGVDSPKYLNKLIIINPDGNLDSKFRSLFGNVNNYKKYRFITGLFSQYNEHIFGEINNLIS